MLQNAIGRPVRGASFYDREREQAALWERLANDHVLLLAPRRVGKTSLMLRLQETSHDHGFGSVYLSVSDAPSEVDFVRKLCMALEKGAGTRRVLSKLAEGPVGRMLQRIRKVAFLEFQQPSQVPWADLGREVLEALAARPRGETAEPWLILLDELPLFLLGLLKRDPSTRRAREFLSWFRQMRIMESTADSIRWVIAGSIGLDTIATRYRLLDTINDLHLMKLGAFAPEDADRFLVELGTSYGMELAPKVRKRLQQRVGWPIPYYLQLLFSELRQQVQEHAKTPSPDLVDRAYETLLSPSHRAYFDYWRQRLAEELGAPDDSLALEMLALAARDPDGVARPTLDVALAEQVRDERVRRERVAFLLDVLENDGYLVEERGRHRFRSPLLREYWRRRVAP